MKTIFVVGARGIPDVEGGVEKSAERIFPELAKRGWRVILIGLAKHISSDRHDGVTLWATPSFRFMGSDKLLYYCIAYWRAVILRPDIVHLGGLGASLLIWAYRLLGCSVIVRYGAADYVSPKWGWFARCAFLLAEYQLRWADHIIAVSPSLANRLNAKGIADNISLIPNAVDAPHDVLHAETTSVHGPYILAVGRITAQKNLLNLIEGFKQIRSEIEGLKLVLAGGLDDRAYVKTIREAADTDVILTGVLPHSELGPLYRGALVFVNSSIHEGHSNAILEAIGEQCPIVTSDIPENRDFDLEAKHYFEPKRPESIARALSRAIAQKEDYRVPPEGFLSWKDVADRTEELCISAVAPQIPSKYRQPAT